MGIFKKNPFGHILFLKKWLIRIMGAMTHRRYRGFNNLNIECKCMSSDYKIVENGVVMIVGEIKHVIIKNSDHLQENGEINFQSSNSIGVSLLHLPLISITCLNLLGVVPPSEVIIVRAGLSRGSGKLTGPSL